MQIVKLKKIQKINAHAFGNSNAGQSLIAFTTEPFDLKCVQLPPHKYM